MDARDRIILPLRLPDDDEGADGADLLLNLLLFDTVIIRSRGLVDVANVTASLGVTEMTELLQTGLIKIHSEIDQIGSTDAPGVVQLMHFFAEPKTILSHHLQSLRTIGGQRHRDIKKLKLAVVGAWIAPNNETLQAEGMEAITAAQRDVVSRSPVFVRAIDMALAAAGIAEKVGRDSISVEEIDATCTRVRIDGISTDLEIARAATRALAGLNQQLAQMRRDEALATLADDSLSLMESKLDFLWHQARPVDRPTEFRRVVNAVGLPDFSEAVAERRINVERLLHVRTSDECQALRQLLNKTATLSETNLRDALAGVRSRLGGLISSGLGKALRVLTTAALGVASVPLGAAASAADTFVVDKLFRTSGAVTFLNKQYRSLFYPK